MLNHPLNLGKSLLVSVCTVASAGSVNCDDYLVAEVRAICRDAPEKHYVIDDVEPDGLNELVDSWGDQPGVYFLPAQDYRISRPVKLKPRQFLLANPGRPPIGKQLRTIGLVATSDFATDDDFFSLLQMADKTAIGMVEINGEQSADSIAHAREKNGRTLVYAPAGHERFMAGCVLTGAPGLDQLLWSPKGSNTTNDDYDYQYDRDFFKGDYGDYFWNDPYNTSPGFQLFRNYFRTLGAGTAVELEGGSSEGVAYHYFGKNNAFIIDNAANGISFVATGLRLRQALAGFTGNDFVFVGSQDGMARYALELQQQRAMVFSHNAFYPANGSHNASNIDSNIFLVTPAEHSWFRFSSNSYNPLANLTTSHPDNSHKPNLISNDEKENPFVGIYPLINVTDFLAFQHDLGTVAMPVAMTLAPNPFLVNGTVDYSALQKKALDDDDKPVDTSIPDQLGDVNGRYFQENRHCSKVILADVIGLPLMYLVAAVGHIGIPLITWRIKRPRKTVEAVN